MYKCKIIYNIDYKNDNLHIIFFPQKVNVFPKNYILYQLEQKDISKWIDTKYELAILYSKLTLDYSQSNIDKFIDIIKDKMIFYQIPLINCNKLFPNINIDILPKNNILFYGSINRIRKNKLMYLQKKLMPKYHVKIIHNIYGYELLNEIINSKIILNIHFYKNAILETYRISEVLSCNRIIISEKPDIIDDDNYNLYKDKVIFIDTLDEMIEKINEILEK